MNVSMIQFGVNPSTNELPAWHSSIIESSGEGTKVGTNVGVLLGVVLLSALFSMAKI